MATYKEYLKVCTDERIDFINITEKVAQAVDKSGIVDGIVLVNSMHITSSVFVNDNESGLIRDFKEWLEGLAPKGLDYHHHMTGEDNGFSHLWRTIMGREAVIAVSEGKLDFGPWESIWYGEFDGQREKRIIVKVVGDM